MVAVARRLTRSRHGRPGAPARCGTGTPASREGAGVSAFGTVRAGGRAPAFRAALAALPGALLTIIAAAACADPPPPPSVDLDDGPVELEPSVAVHDVALTRPDGQAERLAPDIVIARSGDVVRFTSETLDSHALAFRMNRLDEVQRLFLEETGQAASAPLLDRGHAWVLSLEGAPPGSYPLVCLIHEATGRIDVTEAP